MPQSKSAMLYFWFAVKFKKYIRKYIFYVHFKKLCDFGNHKPNTAKNEDMNYSILAVKVPCCYMIVLL